MEEKKQNEQQDKQDINAKPVAQNPNPRANENIREHTGKEADSKDQRSKGVGTEITDGEGG